MAWYLRKAFKLGPIRLNVSKSGLGASLGVKGLRIGTGPRGPYLHGGRAGLYFRQSLTPGSTRRFPGPAPPDAAHASNLEAIDSADVQALTHEHAQDALDAYNAVLARTPLVPTGVVTVAAAALVLFLAQPPALWPWVVLGIAGAALLFLLAARDRTRLAYHLDYALDPEQRAHWDSFLAAFARLSDVAAVWHVGARGDVSDRKYQAGATSVIERRRITPTTTSPPRLRCDLDLPGLAAGRQTLYFLPDCLLVVEKAQAGAVGYADLQVSADTTRFIESESPPGDATEVGRTWQYVNKQGGPDKRFRQNPEWPILLYGVLDLTSPSGLRERFHVSRPDALTAFVAALGAMKTTP